MCKCGCARVRARVWARCAARKKREATLEILFKKKYYLKVARQDALLENLLIIFLIKKNFNCRTYDRGPTGNGRSETAVAVSRGGGAGGAAPARAKRAKRWPMFAMGSRARGLCSIPRGCEPSKGVPFDVIDFKATGQISHQRACPKTLLQDCPRILCKTAPEGYA